MKIHVENLEKKNRLLLDLWKISTEITCHPQTKISVDQMQNLAIQKLEVPSQNIKATLITS